MLYDYIKQIHFAFPIAFGLLALLPFVVWYYLKKSEERQGAFTISTTQNIQTISWKNRFRHLPAFFRLLTLISLIFVLARPQKRNTEQRTEGEGIDIMLCMDVSGSMSSQDILPSRMEAAKDVAADFVRNRPVDRIGLVIFSGEAFTQSPLTSDRNTLLQQIQNLEARAMLQDGTVIGEGLATAVERLSKSTAKSKVIILITDGKEDAPETRIIDPLTALNIAKAKGIKVYTIGMGALTASDTLNNTTTKPDARFNYLDETLLQRIAKETGGQYFRARDRQGLESIYKQIDQLEKSKVEIITLQRIEERYFPFMLAALFFLFSELILRFTLFRKFP